MKSRASHVMDEVFRTGYPHPINMFAALILTLLPLLSPLAEGRMPAPSNGLAGMISLLYLIAWARIRVFRPDRPFKLILVYLAVQTVLVALIYALDGGLTRFLFVVVAVQAVYISPVRWWAPFLGSVAALWLTLYLVISPDPGKSMVSTIGMYLAYLLFAALVTFTAVQQERQNRIAQDLLDDVDRQHHILRAYEHRIAHRTESEERERLAQTICTTLLLRLTDLRERLEQLEPLTRNTARIVRLQAKDILAEVRQVVRTLRPDTEGGLAEEEEPQEPPVRQPQADPTAGYRWTDPMRVYHIWNSGVIVITIGVMIAALLVGTRGPWVYLLTAGLLLLGAYASTVVVRLPWIRTGTLVLQAALIVWMVALSREPLVNHLFLIIAAQIVFMVPPVNRYLAAAVVFPTLLSAAALWLTGLFVDRPTGLFTLTAAFGVTNFFGGVTAFMTRRQVDDRQRAVVYVEQLAEVNRLLRARLEELRRMAIARERVRMAREIHDGLGHHLTIVIMELQYAEQLADEDRSAALEHIASAGQVIDRAITTSRDMVESLERFDRPLAQAITDLVRAWRKGNNPQVTLRIGGDFDGLSTPARITLYRAVQESLTNIQKHARAQQVSIMLVHLPDRVVLTITNDGPTEGRRAEAVRGGFGLLGLKERADALQGEVITGPGPDGGFQVKLVLPVGA